MKGQAALEFLTTYGWAVLVVLIMIGAISYFGILNPTKLLPSRCTISPEFSCADYLIDNQGNVQIVLNQGIGKTIFPAGVSCTYSDVNPALFVVASGGPGTSWSPRLTATYTCAFGPGSVVAAQKGKKIKVSYNISYQTTANTGLMHSAQGEIYSQVQ